MADLVLAARGALDGVSAAPHGRAGEPGVTLAIRPPCRQSVVLARRGQADALVADCTLRGVPLPSPGQASLARDLTIVATAPGQWLVISAADGADTAGPLFAPLAANCSLVQVDDGRTLVDVAGPAARRMLAKILSIDLHPRVFAPGAAAVTVAGGISIVLWQVDNAPRYALAFPRSFAGSLWHWLMDAGAEYGVALLGAAEAPAPARVAAVPGEG